MSKPLYAYSVTVYLDFFDKELELKSKVIPCWTLDQLFDTLLNHKCIREEAKKVILQKYGLHRHIWGRKMRVFLVHYRDDMIYDYQLC